MVEFSYPQRLDDSPSEAVLGSAARMNPSHVGADGDVDGSKRHATELMTSSSGDGEVGHLLEREVDVGRDASSEPEMVRVLEGTARFKVLRSVPDLQAVDLATISRGRPRDRRRDRPRDHWTRRGDRRDHRIGNGEVRLRPAGRPARRGRRPLLGAQAAVVVDPGRG